MLPPNFKRAAAKEDESEPEEEEKQNFDFGEDDDRYTGNSMQKPAVPQGRPSIKSSPPAVGASLTEKMEQLKVDGKLAAYFSFDSIAPVFSKDYVKNSIDKFEVEFLLSPYYDSFFKHELSADGMKVIAGQATPELFGEEKRTTKQMGKDADGYSL